jgi:L-asparagine oxygenase
MERVDFDVTALAGATVELTGDEAGQIRRQCERTVAALGRAQLDSERAMAAMALAGCALPSRLIEALVAFRCSGNAYGTLVVANVPIDGDLPPTPVDGSLLDWHAVPVATVAQLAVSSHLGDVIGFADEKQGQLVQDVIPVVGAEECQENTGSAFLELHTEDGFHPFKPDFLTLLCLRPDHGGTAYTMTGAVAPILPKLSRVCVEMLRRPLFRIRHSSSFARMGSDGFSEPVAVLSGPPADPELVADFHAMEPMTLAARWAIEELETVLGGALVAQVLEAGTLLIVDNRAAVHGRTGFTARYDGTDRWLRRCFTTADLRRSRGCRPAGSRVCAPLAVIRQRLDTPATPPSVPGMLPAGTTWGAPNRLGT